MSEIANIITLPGYFRVEGMVNEKIVNEDTVMRTSGNQVGNSSLTLTGEQTTRFTNIHLLGTLNGLKIDDFFGNTVSYFWKYLMHFASRHNAVSFVPCRWLRIVQIPSILMDQ